MRAFGQRIWPCLPRDHAALMRGIEQQMRTDFIRDGTHLGHRMRNQVQAAAQRDDLGPDAMRQ